jgi:hypothetical protein
MTHRKRNGEKRQAVYAPKLGRKRVSVSSKPGSRQRVRVAGRLEDLIPERGLFSLSTGEGEVLRGTVRNVPAETMSALLGRPVLISGTAFFKRSGALLEIEADHIGPAQGDVSFWSRIPHQILGGVERGALVAAREVPSGVSAVIGQWPGDESEEEILSILAEMS